jgi:hypothetical protein
LRTGFLGYRLVLMGVERFPYGTEALAMISLECGKELGLDHFYAREQFFGSRVFLRTANGPIQIVHDREQFADERECRIATFFLHFTAHSLAEILELRLRAHGTVVRSLQLIAKPLRLLARGTLLVDKLVRYIAMNGLVSAGHLGVVSVPN